MYVNFIFEIISYLYGIVNIPLFFRKMFKNEPFCVII